MSPVGPPVHTVAGGYVDLQINGGWGHYFSDDPGSIWEVAARLPEYGVTAFCPTLISDGYHRLDDALDVLAAGPPPGWRGARPIGLHLEGPWLHPERAGAHAVEALRSPPRPDELPDRLRASEGVVLVTLAPELDGAAELITELRARGIGVSAGHSTASFDVATRALDGGVAMGTHLFNAMSGMHHRAPGLAAALLAHPTASVGLIADGEHVAPAMLDLAWRLAGPRILLVSDAVSALGLTSAPVSRLGDGTLAGATIGLDAGVRMLMRCAGASLEAASASASVVPQRLLESMLGASLRSITGAATELDACGRVVRSIVNGEVVFTAEADPALQ